MSLPETAQPETRARRTRGKNREFWRACRYLAPYRRIVVVSVVCAFLVGLITTTGLSAMLPILRVLINGDTIAGWVDRQVAGNRLGVAVADDPGQVRITRLDRESPAEDAGFRVGDAVTSLDVNVPPGPDVDVRATRQMLGSLAGGPAARDVTLASPRAGGVTVHLPPVPWYLRWGQRVSRSMPAHPVAAIAAVFGIIAGLAMVGNVVRFFQEYLSDKSAISAVNDIRRHLYDHVLHMPLGYFGRQGTSDVTSRLVQDSQGLQDGFKSILGQAVQEPIKAAFALGLSLLLSWRLTLFIVVFAPLMAIVIKKFGKKMRRASRAALQRSSTMLGQIEGTLIGIRVVKSAAAERFERRRYAAIMEGLRQEQLKMARYEAWATPALETISMLVVGLVLIVAACMMFVPSRWYDPIDSTRFFMVLACLVSIGESLRRVSKLNTVLARSNAAAARIFEVLDVPVERRRGVDTAGKNSGRANALAAVPALPETVTNQGRIKLPPVRREVRFENVTFAYPGATGAAVVDVSLSVGKGKSVAVVGRNGSGKTTLLALLPRFYDPQGGRITIDGVDVRDATLRSLRRQVGIVTQDSVIFPGTIAENIAYGHPLAPLLATSPDSIAARELRQQIEDAARRAFAHDFITEKPGGYDTSLDGLGAQVSGGQRQRINIARAILRQAPILILDEATSQVDAESEHLIQQAIEGLMHERTTFVIAHRFSTILGADTIVVMDRGRIVGQGRHEELLATCPTYALLYERQLFAAPVTG